MMSNVNLRPIQHSAVNFGRFGFLRGALAVLLAGVLERLGVPAVLLLTPKTALLGYWRDEEDAERIPASPQDAAELARRTGIQLQQAALLPRLRVGEALELFSSFYDHPVPWRPLLERLGIASKEKTDVARLSGGERQRVFIALALVHDPELLFLDELTTALDPQARLAMWDVVRDIRERGKTVVLTTHYMEEAEALCDRVAVIDHGRLIALDTIPALIAAHGGQATLRLTLSAPAPRTLADVKGVTSVRTDGAVTVVGGTGAFAQAALSHLAQADVVVQDMETHSPGLEEVFLNLTGRALREA